MKLRAFGGLLLVSALVLVPVSSAGTARGCLDNGLLTVGLCDHVNGCTGLDVPSANSCFGVGHSDGYDAVGWCGNDGGVYWTCFAIKADQETLP